MSAKRDFWILSHISAHTNTDRLMVFEKPVLRLMDNVKDYENNILASPHHPRNAGTQHHVGQTCLHCSAGLGLRRA